MTYSGSFEEAEQLSIQRRAPITGSAEYMANDKEMREYMANDKEMGIYMTISSLDDDAQIRIIDFILSSLERRSDAEPSHRLRASEQYDRSGTQNIGHERLILIERLRQILANRAPASE